MKAKNKNKSMDEITKGYEDFIKGKEINPDGKKSFEKAIKKTVTTKTKKQRGSK